MPLTVDASLAFVPKPSPARSACHGRFEGGRRPDIRKTPKIEATFGQDCIVAFSISTDRESVPARACGSRVPEVDTRTRRCGSWPLWLGGSRGGSTIDRRHARCRKDCCEAHVARCAEIGGASLCCDAAIITRGLPPGELTTIVIAPALPKQYPGAMLLS